MHALSVSCFLVIINARLITTAAIVVSQHHAQGGWSFPPGTAVDDSPPCIPDNLSPRQHTGTTGWLSADVGLSLSLSLSLSVLSSRCLGRPVQCKATRAQALNASCRPYVRPSPALPRLTVSICGNDWGPSRPRRQERDGTPKSVKPKSSSILLGREAGGAGELGSLTGHCLRACPPPSGFSWVCVWAASITAKNGLQKRGNT